MQYVVVKAVTMRFFRDCRLIDELFRVSNIMKIRKKILTLIYLLLGFSAICLNTHIVKASTKYGDRSNPIVYDQKSDPWGSYRYDKPDGTIKRINYSGCGLVSFTNMVKYLNGEFIDPTLLADYSINHGYRTNAGTDPGLYKSFCDSSYGKKYKITYVKTSSSFSELKSYLNDGCVANIGGRGHRMCVVDYSENKDKYLVLDSAPWLSEEKPGLHKKYGWITESEIKKIAVSTFYIVKSTIPEKPDKPTIKKDSEDKKCIGKDWVTIKWNAVSGATNYKIYRRKKVPNVTTSYGDPIKTVKNTTEFTDTGLETAAIYYYKVQAVNSAGSSGLSDALRVWTMSNAPTCTVLGSKSVEISWKPIQFADTYTIKRRLAGDGQDYVDVATGLKTTRYVDNGVSPNTKYYYRVYPVGASDIDNITVKSETSAQVHTLAEYELDLNGYLGLNNNMGNIAGYGTADVYVNGTLVGDDVTDYYKKWDAGTTYEIKDIKTAGGKYYYGVTEGSLSGTLTKDTSVRLHYGTMCTDGTKIIPDGDYVIASMIDNTKVLDVANAGTENATNLQLYAYNATYKHQIFRIKYMRDGYYSITDTNSGLSIHVQGSGTTENTNVHMWNSVEGQNAQWVIKKTNDGYYNLIAHCSNMYMDLPNGATANGTNIQIHTGNGSNAQKFELRRVVTKHVFDINGLLDGMEDGAFVGFGTVDVYLDGKKVADDVSDYYSSDVVYGTTYEITDIKASSGHIYTGVQVGLLKGTIYGDTQTRLKFETGTGTDTEAPVVSGSYLTNVTEEGCTFNVMATDNVGVDHVDIHFWCGAWTLEGETVYPAIQSGDTWSCSIPLDLENGRVWVMDARVYDTAGNQALTADGRTVVHAAMRKVNVTLDSNDGYCKEGSKTAYIFFNVYKPDYSITYYSTYGELPTPTRPGHEFAGWYDGNTLVTADTPVKKQDDHTLTAHWERNGFSDIGDSFKAVIMNIKTGMVLTNDGDNVSSRTLTMDSSQIWEFRSMAFSGRYKVRSESDGKVLNASETNVDVSEDGEESAADWRQRQRWFLYGSEDNWQIYNEASNVCLDVYAGETAEGTNIWPCDIQEGNWNQTFKVLKAYEISYDANGGTGAPDKQYKLEEESVTISYDIPWKNGYMFAGWSPVKDGAVAYQPGEDYSGNTDMVFYAVWTKEVEQDLILPESLEEIEAEAFEGGNFSYVLLPEGVKKIGSRAFADCQNLRCIYIPEGTTLIATDAFRNAKNLSIQGKEGSYAEFYAHKYGFNFISLVESFVE